jgi:hypothetical protein
VHNLQTIIPAANPTQFWNDYEFQTTETHYLPGRAFYQKEMVRETLVERIPSSEANREDRRILLQQ